jgi:hypothetical protein
MNRKVGPRHWNASFKAVASTGWCTGRPLPWIQLANPCARINYPAGSNAAARRARIDTLQSRLRAPGVYKRSVVARTSHCSLPPSPIRYYTGQYCWRTTMPNSKLMLTLGAPIITIILYIVKVGYGRRSRIDALRKQGVVRAQRRT